MSTDKVQRSTEGGATHANKDINGLMSLNGVLSDKSGTETNAHQSSEEVMVDSVLWAKANRSQQHRTSGNSLLCTNKALQMMASSGFRTRRMDSPDNGVVSLDDVDVIDLDVLNLDEEDGWLFRLTQPAKDSPSPYAWVRRDFDLKDVGTPRGSLLQTLEQATKKKASRFNSSRLCNTVLSPSGSSDTLSNVLDNGCSANADAVCKTLDYGCTTDSDNAFNSRDNGDVTCPETVCNILNNGSVTNKGNLCNVPAYSETTPKSKGRYEIDTRTFTRPKKSAKNNNNNRNSDNSLVNPVRLSPESSEPGDSEDVGLAVDAAGCGSPESQHPPAVEDTLKDEQFLKLEDVTDVQVLARMQEDSLRQSYSSPVGYTPKSQRRGLPNSPSRLTQGLSNGSLTCHSDVSSPTLSHADPLGITKSTNSLSSASSESSTSRSDSFTNVNASQVQNSRGFSETHQHSLPNLSKTAKFSVPRSVPSDSKLYASPGSRSLPVSATSRAKSLEISISKKTPLTEQSDVSSSSVVDPAPVPAKPKSPTPASKPVSGIPKPNTTSRLRQPAKWKKNLTMPTQNDGNWREGCF